jgi:hypothetical protein
MSLPDRTNDEVNRERDGGPGEQRQEDPPQVRPPKRSFARPLRSAHETFGRHVNQCNDASASPATPQREMSPLLPVPSSAHGLSGAPEPP